VVEVGFVVVGGGVVVAGSVVTGPVSGVDEDCLSRVVETSPGVAAPPNAATVCIAPPPAVAVRVVPATEPAGDGDDVVPGAVVVGCTAAMPWVGLLAAAAAAAGDAVEARVATEPPPKIAADANPPELSIKRAEAANAAFVLRVAFIATAFA
jgi:hypothetical protein